MTAGPMELRPSAAHRWLRCPGSVAACAAAPRESSVYADEGTFAHDIAAKALSAGKRAESYLGRRSDCGRFTVDAAMAGHVQTYLDAIAAVMFAEDGGIVLVEQRVTIGGVVVPAITGTADCIVITGRGVVHVFDFKYGAGVLVDAEDNDQLRIYVLAATVSIAEARSASAVQCHIVQPRCDRGAPWRSSAVIPRADLTAWWGGTVVPAIQAALRDGAALVPGEKQCRFCDAAPQCPARRAEALQVARHVFDDAPTPDMSLLSPDDLSRVLELAPRVEDWIKACRQLAHDRAARGEHVPGWKLVDKIGNRTWKDDTEAEAALRAAGVDPMEAKLCSPAQAEKRLGKARAALVAPLVHRPVTGASLVKDADERPTRNPAAVFND